MITLNSWNYSTVLAEDTEVELSKYTGEFLTVTKSGYAHGMLVDGNPWGHSILYSRHGNMLEERAFLPNKTLYSDAGDVTVYGSMDVAEFRSKLSENNFPTLESLRTGTMQTYLTLSNPEFKLFKADDVKGIVREFSIALANLGEAL